MSAERPGLHLVRGPDDETRSPEVRPARSDPWRASASCRDLPTELFFSDGEAGDLSAAKAVCAGCPVRRTCLAFAVMTGQDHGVWGGTDAAERRRYRRRLR